MSDQAPAEKSTHERMFHFAESLRKCQLLPEADLSSLETFLSQCASLDDLVGRLVDKKLLTRFQCRMILRGKAKSLCMGNYVLEDRIGAGGMGQVFKAYHRRMKREVAIKTLPPQVLSDERVVQRFYREMEAAAKLNHPNIVTAYDADEFHGVHYLVMEYVEGVDLGEFVAKTGPMTMDKAVTCIVQAAKGLEYAHSQGVVHRDVKPNNLLLDRSGTVKVLDLGLARFTETAGTKDGLTATGIVMGTLDYMPPEQAADVRNVDARGDIYSLGCTLFYLVSGKPIYAGETAIQKLLAHREHPIPNFREACPTSPEVLDTLFRRMVAKNPRDRYQDMTELIADLEQCQLMGDAVSLGSQWIDPNLREFLQHQSAGETIDEPNPLNETILHGRARTLPQAPAQPPNGPAYLPHVWLGAAILAVALLVIAFLAWRPSSRTGVLALDVAQGDAVGAEVLLDNNPVATIANLGEQAIELPWTDVRHEVEVRKSGFESFRVEFRFSESDQPRFDVELIPLPESVSQTETPQTEEPAPKEFNKTPPSVQEQPAPENGPLTFERGTVASFSPRSDQMIYTDRNTPSIVLYDLGQKTIVPLNARGKDAARSPVPGGPIAFVREPEVSGQGETLWLMESDGSNVRKLGDGGFPSWSDDGTLFYYDRKIDSLMAYPMGKVAAKPELMLPNVGFLYPVVSPNRKFVAFPKNDELVVMDLATRKRAASMPTPSWNMPLAGWSPDSQYVFVGSYSDRGLFRLDVKTGDARLMLQKTGRFYNCPRFSADFQWMAVDDRHSGQLLLFDLDRDQALRAKLLYRVSPVPSSVPQRPQEVASLATKVLEYTQLLRTRDYVAAKATLERQRSMSPSSYT